MMLRRSKLAVFFLSLTAPAALVAGTRGISPRISLPTTPSDPVLVEGIELRVTHTLTAKPDFELMASGPRQAGRAVLRVRAEVISRPGNPYGLKPGKRIEGLRLSATVRGPGADVVPSIPFMEWIPCQGGPHYEATFILDRPGAYDVVIEPAQAEAEPLGAGAPTGSETSVALADRDEAETELANLGAGVSLPPDLRSGFTAEFTLPDEALEDARRVWEGSSSSRERSGPLDPGSLHRGGHSSRRQGSERASRSAPEPPGSPAVLHTATAPTSLSSPLPGQPGSSTMPPGPEAGADAPDMSLEDGPDDPSPEGVDSRRTNASPSHHDDNPDDENHVMHRGRPITVWNVEHPAASIAEPVSDDMTLLAHVDTRAGYSAGCGYADATGKFAIVGANDGTQIIEVTNPNAPVEWGFIPGCSSSWRECKTYGKRAYMTTEATGCGMQIIDLSNPRAPFLASTYTSTFTTSHTVFINQSTGIMYVNGTRLNGPYSGMQIFDLNAAPVNLVQIGSFNTRYVHDSYEALDPFTGTYKLYLSEIYNGLEEVYDDTVKTAFSRLGSWASPQNFTHNSTVNAAHTVMMTTDEINTGGSGAIFDISNPSTPVLVSTYRGGGPETIIHNAHFDDGDPELVWVAHYTQGVRLLDLHRPSFPLEIGHYDTYPPQIGGFNGCWEVWPYDRDGWAYLIDMDTGLYVVQYEPSGGQLSGVVRNQATGAPVAGASVLELKSGTYVKTNALGVYAMRLPPGAARLRVSGFGGYTTEASTTIDIGQRTDLDMALPPLPASSLTGVVRRSTDSTPISGATVAIAGSGVSTTTGGDGSFVLASVPLGTLRLAVSRFGFSPNEARILLGPQGPVQSDASAAATGLSGRTGALTSKDPARAIRQNAVGALVPTDVTILLEPARWSDDVEADRGWGLGVSDTADVSGRWVRGDPNGTDGGLAQTEDDHTPSPGNTCFLTGNGPVGGSIEGNDVDLGITNLVSPTLDATGLGAAAIDYWRWFSNERGSNTSSFGTFTAEVSNNNGSTWASLESLTKEANIWTNRVFDLGSRVALTNQMKIRIRAIAGSSSTTGVVESAIDDVQLIKACLATFNPLALNDDGDALVNGCDPCQSDPLNDVDGDGVCGNTDRSPFRSDPGQADTDGDLVGDAADNCPSTVNADQADNDGDATGYACDADDDNDGINDAIDADDDGDGVADVSDNCPGARNPDQADHGGSSGAGDACDATDGLVTGERFLGKTILVWDKENGAATYNVYRGELGAAQLAPQASCFARGLVTTFTSDADLPRAGDGSFYLATAVVGSIEQSPGYTSAGSERSIVTHCP